MNAELKNKEAKFRGVIYILFKHSGIIMLKQKQTRIEEKDLEIIKTASEIDDRSVESLFRKGAMEYARKIILNNEKLGGS